MNARGAASRVAPPYTGESVKLEFPFAAVIFAGALLLRATPAVREDSPTPGRVQPRAAELWKVCFMCVTQCRETVVCPYVAQPRGRIPASGITSFPVTRNFRPSFPTIRITCERKTDLQGNGLEATTVMADW
ncbi:hypothetical protein HPB47_001462 [Ixodes persulcatus]|uniref:Uncharacterized protein n=1 Tax=Ixodes persulcatus TaxID=34615 RepID=A0AC60PQG9_IXOPE|nr:hypothetical protein HPB47_001462 [Ixodes persulcatus]